MPDAMNPSPPGIGNGLELGLIGNCSFNALVDEAGAVVWSCMPRPDGDPVLHALLGTTGDGASGRFVIELADQVEARQRYVGNTAILETELTDRGGNAVRITDFAPRFTDRGRTFRPVLLVRRITPVRGRPTIRVRLDPSFEYGARRPDVTRGSHHIRYYHAGQAVRLTTDMPITYAIDETWHLLDRPVNLLFGVDETLDRNVGEVAREFEERTDDYWRHWVRALALPPEWQDAVIRAAITLKLCTYEETGAIMAAVTTSIPEAPDTERTWDYRYCWLRDAFFVVRALNGLSEVATMETYLRYLANIIQQARPSRHLQPVYGIGLEVAIPERKLTSLGGYRGYGPVRVGNQAYEHHQHDGYGHAVLAATQAYFDHRLLRPAGVDDFRTMEWLGERALELYDQPDAGVWEFRTIAAPHTSSAIMCWAACDRLAKIARHLGIDDAAERWSAAAQRIHRVLIERSWNEKRGAFVADFGGVDMDASVLLMSEVGFLPADDPRWRSTLDVVRRELKSGNHLFRYVAADDFGAPTMAFTACTFWYVDALARAGELGEARELF
ncbi:MAG TPA: glycoside hydrolase family 15 protein, partial [Casimicrobiaceae bacterium]|nr:glycoside hydrolase family 15 protein [Casimicrobiaceae bacterium]